MLARCPSSQHLNPYRPNDTYHQPVVGNTNDTYRRPPVGNTGDTYRRPVVGNASDTYRRPGVGSTPIPLTRCQDDHSF